MTTKTKSAISTAIFAGVMLLLMFLISAYTFNPSEYTKENPPKEPPEGFEVSLGEPDRGQGDEPAPSAKQNTGTTTPAAASTIKTPTQNNGADKVNASDKTVVTETPTEEPQTTEINQNAIYKGKRNKNNDAQGTGLGNTGTPGNQGQADGNPHSLNTSGNGGGGLSGNVRGFKVVSHPPIKFTSNQQVNITVTLDVWVDKNGKVTRVEYLTSTYSNVQLKEKAIALAKGTIFAPLAGTDIGDEPRKGTITVTFKNTQ